MTTCKDSILETVTFPQRPAKQQHKLLWPQVQAFLSVLNATNVSLTPLYVTFITILVKTAADLRS